MRRENGLIRVHRDVLEKVIPAAANRIKLAS